MAFVVRTDERDDHRLVIPSLGAIRSEHLDLQGTILLQVEETSTEYLVLLPVWTKKRELLARDPRSKKHLR
jgi:hypothetical protein